MPEKNPKKSYKTIIAKAVFWNKLFSNFLFRFFSLLIWLLGLLSFLLLIGDITHINRLSNLYLGYGLIFSAIFLLYLALRSFNFDKFRIPEIIDLQTARKLSREKDFNYYLVFSYELARVMYSVVKSGKPITTKEIGNVILESPDINFILVRLGISQSIIKNEISLTSGRGDGNRIFSRALDIAIAEGHHQIEIGDAFIALCELDSYFQRLLMQLKIDVQDIANVVYWQTNLVRGFRQHHKLLNPNHLKFTGGIGRDWTYGFAQNLKYFSSDLTQEIKENGGIGLEMVGHNQEITEIIETLSRQKGGDAILVGEEGIGKRTLILGFISKVLEGKTNSGLDYMHVFELHLDLILSDIEEPNEIISRINNIFDDVIHAGNIIVFIENIQNLFSGDVAGTINATEILNSILDYPGIHIIGTCDIASYNQFILPNRAIAQKFTRITVREPGSREMVRILENVVPQIEYDTKSVVSYEAIKETIKSANRYILNAPNPEKSINLLEAASHKASTERGRTIILPKDITGYISEKYEVPAGDATVVEKNKLLNLENIMHKKVIGQDEAIKAIANAMRRARAGISDQNKPIGSFLFLGPTGVGKTETAKALADAYFGSENKMIRFDMSEFKNTGDIYRLIGQMGSNGNVEQGILTTAVREHPFSLILFDEIEKASKDILDLLLQILDEGFVTDGSGRKVSFTNAIIIATSNAGANLVREAIQTGTEYEKVKNTLMDYLQQQGIYRPEFLNRFTAIIAFTPLSEIEIEQVAQIMITSLMQSMKANNGILLDVSADAVTLLAEQGYDPTMGARPMARIIQEKLENVLAVKMLSGELKKGDKIAIDRQNLQ